NIYWLIVSRAIQGAGAGGFVPSATGIVADTFPESRQRYIGLLVSMVSVGVALGPVVGGWLTYTFDWRFIFWSAIPLSALALLAGAVLLKPDKEMQKAHLDIRGAGLLAVSLTTFMIGLTTIGRKGAGGSWTSGLGLLVLGCALMALFLRHERRAKNPVIDLELIRGRPFLGSNIYNVIFGAFLGALTFLPLYAVTVYNASTVESGLVVTPKAIGMMVGSIGSSFMLLRWGYRKPMIVGTALLMVGALVFGFEPRNTGVAGIALGGIAVMLVGVAMSGLGHGISSPASNNACIELMPDKVSTITGIRNACRHSGVALSIAIASLVLDWSGDLARGFEFVFFGLAAVGLLALPCILVMPRSPKDVPVNNARPVRRPLPD
ncbi:MAG: MFS transporter, partial [Chloroflexi bacterium]|nr:MFS transporter [Chloroflexota bacterium]